MPDSFFSTPKNRKRKRSAPHNNTRPNGRTKPSSARPHKKARDEDLAAESGSSGGDIDDLDLRASDIDENASGEEEYANETPAEKRLRLAKIYLESVRQGLGGFCSPSLGLCVCGELTCIIWLLFRRGRCGCCRG